MTTYNVEALQSNAYKIEDGSNFAFYSIQYLKDNPSANTSYWMAPTISGGGFGYSAINFSHVWRKCKLIELAVHNAGNITWTAGNIQLDVYGKDYTAGILYTSTLSYSDMTSQSYNDTGAPASRTAYKYSSVLYPNITFNAHESPSIKMTTSIDFATSGTPDFLINALFISV